MELGCLRIFEENRQPKSNTHFTSINAQFEDNSPTMPSAGRPRKVSMAEVQH